MLQASYLKEKEVYKLMYIICYIKDTSVTFLAVGKKSNDALKPHSPL